MTNPVIEPEDARPADAVPPHAAEDEVPAEDPQPPEPPKQRKRPKQWRQRKPPKIRRRTRVPWRPYGIAKAVYLSGTVIVVLSSTVAGFSRWDSVTWSYAWDGVWAGACIGVLGGIVRIVVGPAWTEWNSVGPRDRSDLAFSMWASVATWAVAAIFAWSMSSTLHDMALSAAATKQVTATVTACDKGDGDDSPQCTYHWTVDGHAYVQTALAEQAWPDGHAVTVWIDPKNPSGPVIDVHGGTPWALVGAAIFGGVLALIAMPAVFADEFLRDDD